MALSELPILNTLLRECVVQVGFASAMMGFIFIILLIRQESWRLVGGVASSVVGMVCYALSSSFNDLFGKWKWWKIMLYILFSFMVLLLVSSAKFWKNLSFFRNKSQVMFLILGSTTIYSFFSDRALQGKPDVYNLVSYAAFAVMSFSFNFMELVYFFSALVTSQLMKIDLLLGFVGIGFCYFLIILPESGLQFEPSYFVISQSSKQRAWKLVIVASIEISLVSLGLNYHFNVLSGELSSWLKILFWILYFIYSSWFSYAVLFSVTGGHLIVLRFKFHTTNLVCALTLASAYCSIFPNNIVLRQKRNAYDLAIVTVFAVPTLGFPKPKPQLRWMSVVSYFSTVLPVMISMFVNLWVCFVAIGLCFLPFILYSYLDATPDQFGPQVEPQSPVVEEASPQSNSEIPSPQFSEGDELSQVIINENESEVVIEIASPESNSESQLQEIIEIPSPQFSEGDESSQVYINEDEPEVVIEIASTESHVMA